MKYYACLPIRRDLIQDTAELFLLAVIDETTLCRAMDLIGKQREVDELTAELEKVMAKLEELRSAELEEKAKLDTPPAPGYNENLGKKLDTLGKQELKK